MQTYLTRLLSDDLVELFTCRLPCYIFIIALLPCSMLQCGRFLSFHSSDQLPTLPLPLDAFDVKKVYFHQLVLGVLKIDKVGKASMAVDLLPLSQQCLDGCNWADPFCRSYVRNIWMMTINVFRERTDNKVSSQWMNR